jgi:hypothetical protein
MAPVDMLAMWDHSLLQRVNQLAEKWVKHNGQGCSSSDINDWSSKEIGTIFKYRISTPRLCSPLSPYTVAFLDALELAGNVSSTMLDRVDELYRFSSKRNAEIRFQWGILLIVAHHNTKFQLVVSFLKEQGRLFCFISFFLYSFLSFLTGRMKYIRPLYRALFKSGDFGKQLAIQTFQDMRANYHPIAVKMVNKDLQL